MWSIVMLNDFVLYQFCQKSHVDIDFQSNVEKDKDWSLVVQAGWAGARSEMICLVFLNFLHWAETDELYEAWGRPV